MPRVEFCTCADMLLIDDSWASYLLPAANSIQTTTIILYSHYMFICGFCSSGGGGEQCERHSVSISYGLHDWELVMYFSCHQKTMHLALMVVYNSNIINMYHAFLWWIELIFRFPMDGIHLVLQGDVLHVLWLSFYAFTRSGSKMTAYGSHAYRINTWE